MPIEPSELQRLSKRATTILLEVEENSREEVKRSIESREFIKYRGVGPTVLTEVAQWCGAKIPLPYAKFKLCPHCGKNIYSASSSQSSLS